MSKKSSIPNKFAFCKQKEQEKNHNQTKKYMDKHVSKELPMILLFYNIIFLTRICLKAIPPMLVYDPAN
jgi:hypothetical protein